jgi:hypothetical protein
MNISDIILYLVILIVPVLFNAGKAVVLKYEQNLPEKQHAALDRFAKYAVQKMEQVYTHNPNKKQLAMAMVQRAFRDAKLPLPSEALVDSAIESFVYELNQAQAPKPTPDPVVLSTGPLPVPPVAPQAPTA